MAFVEDRDPFISDFAESAVWNGTTTISGLFDNFYFDPMGNIAEGSDPRFLVDTDAVVGIDQGDTLVIGSTTYKVRGKEPDGTGFTLLKLEAQ